MAKGNTAIKYNFNNGTFADTNLVDGLGLELMKISAKLTSSNGYVGLSIANRFLRTILPSDRNVETQLLPDTKFVFPYGDAYWGMLLDNSTGYCDEVESFLIGLGKIDYTFIDCGANYGYMSALMTSEAYGKKPSIAIEPDPGTYLVLQDNAEINGNRFDLLNRAIYSQSGIMVDMSDAKHEARSILDEDGNVSSGNVETLALDDILDWVDEQKNDLVMLKLDVEGVEIDAMKGATELMKRELIVFYEDHGADKNHEVSQYFMQELGMKVYYPHAKNCHEMKNLEDIAGVKTNSRTGYDFLATKSEKWLEIITR
ncbi:MAG: FkbM family methyltransferase [Pseudomonadota bacterium]